MRKSLFVKYFTVCTVIILFSFVFLGSVFSVLTSRYLRTERQEMLTQNISKAASFTVYNYEMNNGLYLDKRALRQFYASMADFSNGVIFLTDSSGIAMICTDDGMCVHKSHAVPKSILNQLDSKGSFHEYGKLGGIYSSMHYTVGVEIRNGNGSQIIGYLFASTSAQAISEFLSDIFKMFLIAALSTILICSVIIYIITAMLSRPLRQMSKAAKSFGRGDFSARISYHSLDEVGELAMSFNQMADSLSELETMRKNFIANVSHELKTPMTTIGGFIDGILDGTIKKDEQEHYLQIVSDEVQRLSRLVKAMLNVVRLEAGEISLNIKPFNISNTIISTLFNFEKKIEGKEIEVRGLAEMDRVMILGDEDIVHQVVYNLIDNAVKFCNNGGYIEFLAEKSKDRVNIHVKNSGNGLTKEEVNHVFDRFYKTDKSRGLDKNGVGLGLHIVKSALDLHNGSITVGSVAGEYTEFIFSLPLYSDKMDDKKNRDQLKNSSNNL